MWVVTVGTRSHMAPTGGSSGVSALPSSPARAERNPTLRPIGLLARGDPPRVAMAIFVNTRAQQQLAHDEITRDVERRAEALADKLGAAVGASETIDSWDVREAQRREARAWLLGNEHEEDAASESSHG